MYQTLIAPLTTSQAIQIQNNTCEVKSTELMKHLKEEKLEKFSDVAVSRSR